MNLEVMSSSGSAAGEVSWIPYGTESMMLNLENGRWLMLDKTVEEEHIMSLFAPCPWTLFEAAEQGLRNISLRKRPAPAIALGVHRDALVLSMNLGRNPPNTTLLDAAMQSLLRFLEVCLRS